MREKVNRSSYNLGEACGLPSWGVVSDGSCVTRGKAWIHSITRLCRGVASTRQADLDNHPWMRGRVFFLLFGGFRQVPQRLRGLDGLEKARSALQGIPCLPSFRQGPIGRQSGFASTETYVSEALHMARLLAWACTVCILPQSILSLVP